MTSSLCRSGPSGTPSSTQPPTTGHHTAMPCRSLTCRQPARAPDQRLSSAYTPTRFCYTGDADPSAPGGMAAIYRDLAEDSPRTSQVTEDVCEAVARGRHCLGLTQWTAHLERLTAALQDAGHDPVVLRGGMGAKARTAALARLEPKPGQPPLLAVATGSYIGEGFDCPALDTLFLAAPISFKGRLVQYAGRILRPFPGKTTAEIHDYHDTTTSVLAASLAKRAPGYTSLGFPDPAASPIHPVRAQPGKSLTRLPIANAVLPGARVPRLGTQPLLNRARQQCGDRS